MPLFLTNIDLLKAASQYNIPLRDVFSKDQQPPVLCTGGYIINLENSVDSFGNRLDGSHWVALWIELSPKSTPKVVYFDSFGFPPPWDTQNLLRDFVPYKYNRIQIQSTRSGICGYYALFFIWWMANQREKFPNIQERFNRFIRLFNHRKPEKNREILQNSLKKYIKNL